MRISTPFASRDRHGYALMITLVFLAVSLVTMGSVLWWSSSNGKVTRQNELFTTTEAAADAANEQVVATLIAIGLIARACRPQASMRT